MNIPDDKDLKPDQTPTPSTAETTQQTHALSPKGITPRLTIRKIANAAAIGSIMVALGASGMNKGGAKTPRAPFIATKHSGGSDELDGGIIDELDAVSDGPDDEIKPDSTKSNDLEAGITDTRTLVEGDIPDAIAPIDASDTTQLDPCQVELAGAQDNPKPENASPNNPCYHEIYKDGTERWDGFPIVDQDGKKRSCFFTRPFAPDAALRLNGTVRGSINDVGDISLEKGQLCARILEKNVNPTRIFINAEAAVAIATDKAVLLYRYEEKDATSGKNRTFLDVVARAGKTVINQAGGDTITLNEGEGRKIPLDIEYVQKGEGCYIASSSEIVPSSGKNSSEKGVLLAAGAIFLALRRRKAKKD